MNDIFAGLYVDVFYSNKTDNTTFAGLDFTRIPEISVFPEIGIERQSIDVPNFSTPTNRKLVGRAGIPDITLSVNYIPSNPAHEALIALANSGKRSQFKIVYYTDDAKDLGFGNVYNCFVSSATLSGGSDTVTSYTFTLAVDTFVAKGTVDTSGSGGAGTTRFIAPVAEPIEDEAE